jgi:hypothetical protein
MIIYTIAIIKNIQLLNKIRIGKDERILPLSVAPTNSKPIQQDVLKKLQTKAKKLIDKYDDVKLVVGDQVRISTASVDSKVRKLIKANEAKKIIYKFTEKIYTVSKVIYPDKPFEKPTYQVTPDDYSQKHFYSNELQKLNVGNINE